MHHQYYASCSYRLDMPLYLQHALTLWCEGREHVGNTELSLAIHWILRGLSLKYMTPVCTGFRLDLILCLHLALQCIYVQWIFKA